MIRWYLKRENKIRAALLAAQGVDADTGVGKVLERGADGRVVERIIDRGMLDLVCSTVSELVRPSLMLLPPRRLTVRT